MNEQEYREKLHADQAVDWETIDSALKRLNL